MKRFVGLFILLFFLITTAFPAHTAASPAHTPSTKTLRVGKIDIDRFFEQRPDGHLTGYGVAFLNEIAKYTGWRYEFVPGSWSECIQWLREGKIDLLFPAEKSPERMESFIFSKEPCAMDYVGLYTHVSNESLFFEDFPSFNGMRVGMIAGNQLNTAFNQTMDNLSITVNRVMLPTVEALKSALNTGEVEAIVYGVMNEDPNQKLLAKINYMPTYFMMSKNNAALMEQLNSAMHRLYLQNPYVTSRLYDKFYSDIEDQAVGFTREEATFIKASSPISVALDADSYPFEWYDFSTGEYRGIYTDLIRKISQNTGLTFEFLPPDTQADSWKKLTGKDVILLGSAVNTASLLRRNNMVCTDSYFMATYNFIGRRAEAFTPEKPLKVAVHKNQVGTQHRILEEYPHWSIVPCDSARDCLALVAKGQADIASLNAIVLQGEPFLYEMRDLTTIFGASVQVPVGIGIEANNPLVLSVLNKGICKINARYVQQCVLRNTVETNRNLSLSNFIFYFPQETAAAGIFLSIGIAVFLILAWKSRMQARQNAALSESYKHLQEVMRQKDELKVRSEKDLLTDLYNKATFRKLAELRLSATDRSHTLLFIDMDNFKTLNDQCGHVAGDAALKEVASVLRANFREDDLVGRFGGDEFYVFMDTITEGALRKKMRHICDALSTVRLDDKSPSQRISISAGVAVSPRHGETFDELLRKADIALYQAKELGKQRVEFYSEE